MKALNPSKSVSQLINPLRLVYLTDVLRSSINTTIPILPNDITIIVDILEVVLKYVMFISTLCGL